MTAEDVKKLCNEEKGARHTVPVAYYDNNNNTLFGFDSFEDIKQVPITGAGGDESGDGEKIWFEANRETLVKLLSKSAEHQTGVEKLRAFPFPILRLNLSARPSGTGVSGRITLEKPGPRK
jgi:hypothetical protein